MRKYILIFALAAPLSAAAQFFDHFEGNELAGHWRFLTEGSQWEHNVSNSMLNVTRLYGPFNFNQVDINTWLGPYADFEMTVVLGWTAGFDRDMYAGVAYEHIFAGGVDLGGIRYRARPGALPTVTIGFRGAGGTTIDAPAPGMYEFRLRRIGDAVWGYFNGELIYEATGVSTLPARYAVLGFGGADTDDFGSLHIDSVGMVPEPGTMGGLLGALVWIACRRRCKNGG